MKFHHRQSWDPRPFVWVLNDTYYLTIVQGNGCKKFSIMQNDGWGYVGAFYNENDDEIEFDTLEEAQAYIANYKEANNG